MVECWILTQVFQMLPVYLFLFLNVILVHYYQMIPSLNSQFFPKQSGTEFRMYFAFNAFETLASLFELLLSHVCLNATCTCCCIWVPVGKCSAPWGVALPSYFRLLHCYYEDCFGSCYCLVPVFSVDKFQDKVGGEGLKLCARFRYGKRKVSAKCCQMGLLQRWAGYFLLKSALDQPNLPGNTDQWESSLKPSAIQSWLKLYLLNIKSICRLVEPACTILNSSGDVHALLYQPS